MNPLNATFYCDEWEVRGKVTPDESLVAGKRCTIPIEQKNSAIRHYLARMIR